MVGSAGAAGGVEVGAEEGAGAGVGVARVTGALTSKSSERKL